MICLKSSDSSDTLFSFTAGNMSRFMSTWREMMALLYDLIGQSFVLREKQGIKSGDIKKIESVIAENTHIIIKRWKEHFEE